MAERSRDGRLTVGIVHHGRWWVAKHVDHVRGWEWLICDTEPEACQAAAATLAAYERDHPAAAPGAEEAERGRQSAGERPERP